MPDDLDERKERLRRQEASHRAEVCERLGFDVQTTVRIVDDVDIDLSAIRELVGRGCDPLVALDIVT